jgi:mRNA interferase MazF
VVNRGEIYWANLQEAGRRPALVVTRSAAIPHLTRVIVAPVTRTVREIASEVPVGPAEGLPAPSVASCDNLLTVDKRLFDPEPVGRLDRGKVALLDRALRLALGIRY